MALPRLDGKFSQRDNGEIESQKSKLIRSDVQIHELKNVKSWFVSGRTSSRFFILSLSMVINLCLCIKVGSGKSLLP